MKIIIEIIKGIIIGVANVIPGVSGGTLAVAMGIYEKLIYAVNNIFKTPVKCLKELWTYILGIAIGIAGSVVGIVFLFDIAPVPTSMLFVGFIIGALPTIKEKLGTDKLRMAEYIVFTIMAAIIIFMPIMSSGTEAVVTSSAKDLITLFLLGILASATMVIPGVSGSMMLMALGYYTVLMTLISDTFKAFLCFDFSTFFSNLIPILPFAIGVVIGIFLMAKLIEILLKKYHTVVYWGIMGLIVASPFPIILQLNMNNISIFQIVLSVILLIAGMYVTKLLANKEEGDKENEENTK